MLSDTHLKDLICALSVDDHFFKKPIVLSNCGHVVCKDCLNENQSIKCNICGVTSQRSIENEEESSEARQLFQSSLGKLYSILEKKMNLQFNKVKKILQNQFETIDLHVKYIEEEIEIRIESLKIEIDKIHDDLKDRLRNIKQDFLKYQNNVVKDHNVDHIENDLIELRKFIETKSNDENLVSNYEKKLKSLNETIYDLNQFDFQLFFNSSNTKLEHETVVGQIVYQNTEMNNSQANESGLRAKLKNDNYKIIELDVTPYDICVLQNNQIITANLYSLALYNENLELVKTIHKIGNRSINAISIAISYQNNLYVVDYSENTIIVTDTNFNKKTSFGSKGSNNDQFLNIWLLRCKNNNLYVCDSGNKRIQIFTLDFKFLRSLALDYVPWKIGILNDTLSVSSWRNLFFYDLKSHELMCKKDNFGRISVIGSMFYQFSYQSKKVLCYNEHGELLEEIDIERLGKSIQGEDDGLLAFLNKNLVMTSFNARQFIQF